MEFFQAVLTVLIKYFYSNMVFFLIMGGLIGFVCYVGGDMVRSYNVRKLAEGERVTFPYQTVSLALNIYGVVVMLACAVLLYFAGAYEPFIKLLR
jgi:hypothetical protein